MTVALLLLLLGGACPAQEESITYIGLYADENHSTSCVTGTLPFYRTAMWIWVLPNEAGFKCAEFSIAYPDNAIGSTVTRNPAIAVELGALPDGISCCCAVCITDWIWLYKQEIFVSNFDPTWIEIAPNPNYPWESYPAIYTCEEGYCTGLSDARNAASMKPT